MSAERYKTLRVLNEKGTVQLIKDSTNGSRAVMKTLSPESLPIYRRIAELPPHENLERIYECTDNTAVCEYFEGKTLSELLCSKRTFPLSQIKSIMLQLCQATEFLHKNGVIHRDINPNNIMLDDSLRVKLIDFGISRLYNGRRSHDTTIYGTEGYSAPEQYGFRETRFTADVYSIGMVLKILLNNSERLPAAQEVILRRIAEKCTAFSPDNRYRSAAAVKNAVRRSGLVVPAVIAFSVMLLAAALTAVSVILHRAADREESGFSSVIQTEETAEQTALQNNVSVTSTVPAATTGATTAPVTTAQTTTSPATTAQTTTSPATTAQTTTAPVTTTQTTTAPVTTAQTTTAPVTTAQTTKAATTTSSKATTTKADTTKATTQTTTDASAEPSEPEEIPQELHTSDMNDPNKIEITTKLNENGSYQDYFEYRFYDDPAVHGDWTYCKTIRVSELNSLLTADYIMRCPDIQGRTLLSLSVFDDGRAETYYQNDNGKASVSYWTNGYLIFEPPEGTVAQRMFAATLDGTDFLFVGVKAGDFHRDKKVDYYVVFIRK